MSASVCAALRAHEALGGHVTLSITMDASFLLLLIARFSLLGIAGQASHLGSFTFPPGLDIGKIKLKVSKITTLGWVFWLRSC